MSISTKLPIWRHMTSHKQNDSQFERNTLHPDDSRCAEPLFVAIKALTTLFINSRALWCPLMGNYGSLAFLTQQVLLHGGGFETIKASFTNITYKKYMP